MALINMTEKIVRNRLDELLMEKDCCKCEICYTDMLAIVLNSLPPQYVNSYEGEVLKRLENSSVQKSIDMDIAILKAIEIVSRVDHHMKAAERLRRNPLEESFHRRALKDD